VGTKAAMQPAEKSRISCLLTYHMFFLNGKKSNQKSRTIAPTTELNITNTIVAD
jgi:hypothetical protein